MFVNAANSNIVRFERQSDCLSTIQLERICHYSATWKTLQAWLQEIAATSLMAVANQS
jgi:hypothetical protein